MYLQLADNGNDYGLYDCGPQYMADPVQLIQSGVAELEDFYIWVPDGEGNWNPVREDLLDDLSDVEFQNILDNQPFMDGLFKKNPERVARRQARRDRKAAKREAKSSLRLTTIQQKQARRAAGETGLSRLTGAIQSAAGAILPGGGGAKSTDGMVPMAPPVDDRGFNIQGGFSKGLDFSSPAVLIPTVAVGLGLAYFLARRAGRKK